MKAKFEILEVREASGEAIRSPGEVANSMNEEAKADRECFWVIHLNNVNRVVEKELVSIGTAGTALVHPREVFKKAILNGSTSIITVHNHPGGRPSPSPEDQQIWERLDRTGEIVGIKVLDHLIITASNGYYSERTTS